MSYRDHLVFLKLEWGPFHEEGVICTKQVAAFSALAGSVKAAEGSKALLMIGLFRDRHILKGERRT